MPEVLYDSTLTLVIVACEELYELTQEELRQWIVRTSGRELVWHNILDIDGLHRAMFFARGSAVLTGRLASYLHKCLHLHDD